MKPSSLRKEQFGQTRTPGPAGHTLSEIFPDAAIDAAAVGYMLSRLPRSDTPVLWVQDRISHRETGRPYLAGLKTGRPFLIVTLSRTADVLWALEDGLRCRALAAVIGEVWGDPAALDFTATKRLALRSEAANIPCWLIRHAASPNLSAARERWRIGSAPSAPHPYDAHAPGAPRWSLDLFRSRRGKQGQWTVTYDQTENCFDHAAPLRAGALATHDGTARQRALG
jgi:protein ImuA